MFNVYPVIAQLEQGRLGGEEFVATVVDGHRKVRGLFVIREDRAEALFQLARIVFNALRHSRFATDELDGIAVLIVKGQGRDADSGKRTVAIESHTYPLG
ncbi:hypothetical protein [Actinocorallia longicatena]|uniref:Uncharacterized protein n=1 Tax=Actinocorallia longicatena TaxID=111803 RepID=A0ABP6QMW5_9ACTN